MTSATQGFQEYLCLDSRRHALHLCLSCPSALQTLGASHGTQDTLAFRLTFVEDAASALPSAVQFAAVTTPILLVAMQLGEGVQRQRHFHERTEGNSIKMASVMAENRNGHLQNNKPTALHQTAWVI
jgi:hypothetical protein